MVRASGFEPLIVCVRTKLPHTRILGAGVVN